MKRKNRVSTLVAVAILTGAAALASDKPNFTGTWELTRVERDGITLTAPSPNMKETQIWVHQEPKLTMKIMTFNGPGYTNVELEYVVGGQPGTVGTLTRANGTKDPVTGSTHWDGNRLVYEQGFPNARKGLLGRIVRTLTLEDNGSKMVARQVLWMAGDDKPREATWRWEKKSGTP